MRNFRKLIVNMANLLKIRYFQRKHKEKCYFPLIIETFLLYL